MEGELADKRICPSCQKELPDELEAQFCPYCGAALSATREEAQAGPDRPVEPDSGTEGIPWEDTASGLSFIQRLTQTWSDSLFRPAEFFSRMPVRGGALMALGYALIFIIMGQSFQAFWQKAYLESFAQKSETLGPLLELMMQSSLEFQLLAAPIIGVIGLLLMTLIYHVSLVILGAAKNGMEATFRVLAYSEGTLLFAVLPFVGQLISLIWSFVLLIIGFREAHETTTGKAAFAVFLPFLLCCAVLFTGILFVSVLLNVEMTGQ